MLHHHRRTAVPSFRVERLREAGTVVIELSGELDVATVPALEPVVDLACVETGPVLVDLSTISFIDSTGLQALLAVRHRITDQGRRFGLARSTDGQVDQVLEITGTDQVFVCYPDRATALDALRD